MNQRMTIPSSLSHFRSPIMPNPRRAPVRVDFDLDYGPLLDKHAARPFHYLSTTVSCRVDSLYIPVELSIVEFSFEKGVIRHYHKIFEQNSLPKGLSYDCSLQMQRHRIDAEAHADGSNNYGAGIFQEIVDFFGGSPLIMFCDDVKLEQNIGIINSFQKQFKEQTSNDMSAKIYGLQQLADHFRTNSESSFTKPGMVHLMQKAFFDSYLVKNCHYHSVLQTNLCTQDEAYKTVYAFVFVMSVFYNVEVFEQIPDYSKMKTFLQKMAKKFSTK